MNSNQQDDKPEEYVLSVSVHDVALTEYTAPSSPPETWRRPGRQTMARKKVSTTIYIEPEQLDLLKLLNERTKVPMAEYIREGIDLILRKHQDKLPGQLPLDASASIRKNIGNTGGSSNSE
jgi:Ribbon-helix-helix domain